jgi:hypothetical protein
MAFVEKRNAYRVWLGSKGKVITPLEGTELAGHGLD